MIERRHPLQPFVQGGDVTGVAAIGICPGSLSRRYESLVLDHFPLGCRPVGASLDIVHLTDGNAVEINHIATDMRQLGLFTEQVSATRHPVFQGNGLDRQRAVFVDNLLLLGIHRMEVDLVVEIVAEHAHLLSQHLL